MGIMVATNTPEPRSAEARCQLHPHAESCTAVPVTVYIMFVTTHSCAELGGMQKLGGLTTRNAVV